MFPDKTIEAVGALVNNFVNSGTDQNRLILNRGMQVCDISPNTLKSTLIAESPEVAKMHRAFIKKIESMVVKATDASSLSRYLVTNTTDSLSPVIIKHFGVILLATPDGQKVLIAQSNAKLRQVLSAAEKEVSKEYKVNIKHGVGGSTAALGKLIEFRETLTKLSTSNSTNNIQKRVAKSIEDITKVHARVSNKVQTNLKFLEGYGSLGAEILRISTVVTVGSVASNLAKAQLEKRAVEAVRNTCRASSFKEYIIAPESNRGLGLKDKIRTSLLNTLTGELGSVRHSYSYANTPPSKSLELKSKELGIPSLHVTDYFRELEGSGKFDVISISGLQALLDAKFNEKLKEDMGEGSRQDILNNRTGNFAKTTKIEGLSLTRDDAIQVYYKYQKYIPGQSSANSATGKFHAYDSFEPGNSQGNPVSRNPRLLIGKTVREILGPLVANRLKLVDAGGI
jgi:hypothetical protein